MSAPKYTLSLTGGQLRVLHETLSMVLNDPYWPETTATSLNDFQTLDRAHNAILVALRTARRNESTPA